MKLFSIIILFWLFANSYSASGQTVTSSEHQISFYVNGKEEKIKEAAFSVVISGDTLRSKKINDIYYFPLTDTSVKFDLIVRVNSITFVGRNYPGWMLNKGSSIYFGKLTKLKDLVSVAADYELTEKDEDWDRLSKKYYVVRKTYTLDIEDRSKIKELHFLIYSPNNSDRLVTTQQVVR